MHIAFVTSEYPPLPSGGIGTSVRALARALVEQGHRVTVLGWGRAAEFDDRGVKVRFFAPTPLPKMGWLLNRLRAQRELNRLSRAEGLAIVEAPDWCGLSAGMRLDCPLVIRCNGAALYFAHLLGERARASVRAAERLALRSAAGVVAVSAFTATTTRQLFGLARPVGVIPNGIDLAQFQPALAHERQRGVILYTGTIIRKKGVLDLCAIFPQLLERYPQAQLWLVGRDAPDQRSGAPSTWALCQQVLPERCRDRVIYVGPRPHEQVQAYLRRAAVCVFPSYAEALPLAWLEAMACACPVVAYATGWAPEVIEPGVSGMLAPAGDTQTAAAMIAGLLADSDRAAALGAAARGRVEERFSATVVAQQSAAWYRQVIGANYD